MNEQQPGKWAECKFHLGKWMSKSHQLRERNRKGKNWENEKRKKIEKAKGDRKREKLVGEWKEEKSRENERKG